MTEPSRSKMCIPAITSSAQYCPGYLPPSERPTISSAGRNTEGNLTKELPANGRVSVRPHETARVDISLERGAAISGRVLYADGSPAIRVYVNVEDVDPKPFDDRTVGIGMIAAHVASPTDHRRPVVFASVASSLGPTTSSSFRPSTINPTGGDVDLIPGHDYQLQDAEHL